MNNPLLFEQLFHRSYDDSGNAALLEKLVQEHPCFAPARFFLLQKTDRSTPAYAEEANRTALFFNNPHWLNFQLSRSLLYSQNDQSENTDNNDDEAPVITVQEAEQPIPTPEQPEELTQSTRMEPFAGASQPETAPSTASNAEQENSDNNDDAIPIAPDGEPVQPEASRGLTTEAMLFEPMHMVDYFASQGIKLTEEAITADKLGKQLKSFTEWLKTMKKIPTGSVTDNGLATEGTDRDMQQLADKSNAGDIVLTESMAEVLAKQGKPGRAIEVYEKLSLLNPSKSAYFAAKIEQLKGT